MASPNQLSFLPDDYLERKAQRRTNAICAVIFCAVIGGVAATFWLSEKATKAVESEYATVDSQYVTEAKRIEQVLQMHEKQQRMAHQAELTASLLEKVPRSYILAELTNQLPAGVSLLDFNMESKMRQRPVVAPVMTDYEKQKAAREASSRTGSGSPAPVSAEPKLYDVSMKLTGICSTDVQVGDYMKALNKSKVLRDVNLLITEEFVQGGDKLLRFQIEMTLSPDAEVKPEDVKSLRATASTASTSVEAKE